MQSRGRFAALNQAGPHAAISDRGKVRAPVRAGMPSGNGSPLDIAACSSRTLHTTTAYLLAATTTGCSPKSWGRGSLLPAGVDGWMVWMGFCLRPASRGSIHM
eukprot:scaffold12430_cov21-Tisochrysis_lutea.AAC.3